MTFKYPTYEVLVCTFNGAEYIGEQLDSILRQSPAPIRILVSDDGSSDTTLAIVRQIAASVDIPISIISAPQKGIVSNVFNALAYADADYVFLADQDDIWLEKKASLFCEKMLTTEEPHLIFSDALVWMPETDYRRSFWQQDELLPNNSQDTRKLAFHNCVQGASSAMNQALIRRILPHSDIAMHDWWIGLVAASSGVVSIIDQPTLLYRQHASNQIGSQHSKKGYDNLVNKKQKAKIVLRQACAFSDLYKKQMNREESDFFSDFSAAMRGGFAEKISFLFSYRPFRKNILRTITLWASILLIRLPK